MKNMIVLLVAIGAVVFVKGQQNAEALVEKSLERFRLALISADKNELEALTSPKLSYGHSSGLTENRTAFIQNLINKKSDFVIIKITDQSIIINEEVAVVRHFLDAETVDGGKPGSVKLQVMLIWQKDQDGWKLLARQAVKVL